MSEAPFAHNFKYMQTHLLAKKFAKYCKNKLYAKSHAFTRVFPVTAAAAIALEMNKYFNTLRPHNKPAHYTVHTIMHEMMRTSLHIHFPILRKLCSHYLGRLKHKAGHHAQTRPTWECVKECVMEERDRNRLISNAWDTKLTQLLLQRCAQEYYEALDSWFTSLRDDIVLVQWCADWRNDLLFWTDDHGPLKAFLFSPEVNGLLATYRLLNGTQTLRFSQYFGNDMEDFKKLANEDLESIIKSLWHACVKGGMWHNSHNGLKYNGAREGTEFIKKRSIWLSGVKSEYDKHAAYWKINNKDGQYDMMKTPVHDHENNRQYKQMQTPLLALSLSTLNTNIYCISPTCTLNTSGVLLINPFTTSTKPQKEKKKKKDTNSFHVEKTSSEEEKRRAQYNHWLTDRNNNNSTWDDKDQVYYVPRAGDDDYQDYNNGDHESEEETEDQSGETQAEQIAREKQEAKEFDDKPEEHQDGGFWKNHNNDDNEDYDGPFMPLEEEDNRTDEQKYHDEQAFNGGYYGRHYDDDDETGPFVPFDQRVDDDNRTDAEKHADELARRFHAEEQNSDFEVEEDYEDIQESDMAYLHHKLGFGLEEGA